MKTKNLYIKDNKKPVNLFKKNIKIIKKEPDKSMNNRYQNVQNQDYIFSNNHLIYESFNKKGYNGIKDPTLSGNNNFLITKNEINPYKTLRYSTNTMINPKNGIGKKYQKTTQNNEGNKKSFNPNRLLKSDMNRNIANNNNIYKNDFLKWNNIGYKEIKYKNNFEIPVYENYSSKSHVIKNFQHIPTSSYDCPVAHNLGFYNSNYSQKNIKPNNDKYNHSSIYYKQNTTPINSNEKNRLNNLYYSKQLNNNNPNTDSNNILIMSNDKNINNFKTPDHYRANEMDESSYRQRNIINSEINLKKKLIISIIMMLIKIIF